MCLTDVPENMVKIEKPEGYDPSDYELGARYLEAEPIFSRLPFRECPTARPT